MFWRPVRAAHQELDGEGARLYGARWNSPGRPVIYTASSLSLAVLEVLVHASRENLPGDLVALGIEGPDTPSLETIDVDALPEDWYELPNHPACRAVGDEWLVREASVLLRVPFWSRGTSSRKTRGPTCATPPKATSGGPRGAVEEGGAEAGYPAPSRSRSKRGWPRSGSQSGSWRSS